MRGTSTTATASPAKARATATFESYFWEAYNELVQPHRFDWYLVTRWLPDLGPEAFALLKALRHLCYFNPKDGALRDTCQITVDELAVMVGMKRATVYRVLEGNGALKAFVQKQPEALFVEGRTRRLPPRFRVCMDTPIHPADLEDYEALRVKKEHERAHDSAAQNAAKRKSQFEIYEQRKSQLAGRKSQDGDRKSQAEISFPTVISLPSESIPSGYIPASPEPPSHNCVPPEGDQRRASAPEAEPDCPLAALWHRALDLLACRVNKPTLEAHLRPLVLASVGDDGTALLLAPHAATRDWIEKRHLSAVAEALTEALDRPVTVQLRTVAAQAVTRSRHDGTGL
jgi:hypothetical protein